MKEVWWLGANNPEAADPADLACSNALADAAREYQWSKVLELLAAEPNRVNAARIGGKSGFAPLHQAAHGGAPIEVVQALIEAGAYRTLRTTSGDRPVDLARQRGHTHLLELLEPRILLPVFPAKLQLVEEGVHTVIRQRQLARPFLTRHAMRLPPLEVLTEIPGHQLWFPVPGMYGGFHLQLRNVADEPVCLVDSWSRMDWESEERHRVSTGGIQKVGAPVDPLTIIPMPGTSSDPT